MAITARKDPVVDLPVRWLAWFELWTGLTVVAQKQIYSTEKPYPVPYI